MKMAKLCPMSGCKEKQGMCIHDKAMVFVALAVIAFVIYRVVI